MLITFITDIGDSAVLGAVVLAGVIYFFLSGYRIGAMALAVSLVLSGGLISGFKLLFLGCNWFLPQHYDLHSPSGHAALSTAVLGTCLLLVFPRLSRAQKIMLTASCTLLVAAIAASRVVIGAHTLPEVLLGLVAGGITLACVYGFLHYMRRRMLETPPEFNVGVFAFLVVCVVMVLNGVHLPAENYIRAMAYYLGHNVHACMQ